MLHYYIMPKKKVKYTSIKKNKEGSDEKEKIRERLRSKGIIIPKVCPCHPVPDVPSDVKEDNMVEPGSLEEVSWLSWLTLSYL